MSKSLRNSWRALLAAGVIAAIATIPAAGTAAFSYAIQLSRLDSGVGTTFTWKGQSGSLTSTCDPRLTVQECLATQMIGTVYENWSVYREVESDTKYDYYVAQTYVHWTGGDTDLGFGTAPGWIQIWSNVAAVGGPVYDADESATPGPVDCQTISVGAQLGFFQISASPTLCSGTSVNLKTLDSTNAIWRTQKVARTPKWDVWYAIKVPAGVKPKMTYVLTFQHFTMHVDSNRTITYDTAYTSYNIPVQVP